MIDKFKDYIELVITLTGAPAWSVWTGVGLGVVVMLMSAFGVYSLIF